METSATFEQMLTGGHPNSLGQTVGVVDIVIENGILKTPWGQVIFLFEGEI
jgi:hypothetical protein